MNAITAAQPQAAIVIRQAAALPVRRAAAATAASAAPRNPHRFADAMEAALTGIVLTGVLLFAAGLLRAAAPACTARLVAEIILTALAIASGNVSIFFVGRGLFGK
jgi:predicted lipid-binding transport protein (Tim44 family)